jgi:nucleoid-associated protein YgaU
MANFKGRHFSDAVSGDSATALLDAPLDAESNDPTSQEDADATDRMYVVGEDDSLSSIARKFYGTASARRRILEANRALIHDPYVIQPGWRLRIPA